MGQKSSLWSKLKFLIPISMKPNGVNLRLFLSNIIHSLKYQRSTTSGCKDIGIGKSEFLAKTHFSCFRRFLIYKQKYIYGLTQRGVQRKMNRQKDKQIERCTDRKKNRQKDTDRKMNKQKKGQIER